MKKIIAVAMLACMTMAFAGCSQNTADEESQGQTSIEESVQSSADSSAEESSKQESSKQESSKQESSKQESSKQESSKEESKKEESKEESSKQESSETEESVQESSAAPEQQVITTVTETVPAESSQETQQPAQSQPEQPAEPSVVPASTGSYSNSDLSFIFNGSNIALLTKINDALAVLGTASNIESLPSCLSIDSPDDKLYHYNGFTVQTLTDSEGEKIYNIDITGAGAATSKGIAVGSSTADIEAAYGKAAEQDEMLYSYTVDGGKNRLEFFLENGKVTEIVYSYAP